jgi:hypothetical protein
MHPCELLKHDEKVHYDDMPSFSFCLTPRVLYLGGLCPCSGGAPRGAPSQGASADPSVDQGRRSSWGGRRTDNGPGSHGRGAPGRRGLPIGGGARRLEDLLGGFEPAANVVTALVPADQVLNEDP